MVLSPTIQQSDMSRVWVIPFTAGPNRAAVYEGLARADTPSQDFGTPTPIFIPSSGAYRQFDLAGKVLGDTSLPTLSVMWYYILDAQSVLERYVASRCPHDLQIHMGECRNPLSFNEGFSKILVMEGALPTSWGTDVALGALAPDGRNSIQEEVPFTGDRIYHIYLMQYQQQAETEVVQEVVAVAICDAVQCGACGVPSNGADKLFALTLSNAGSPGLPAEIIFSNDGGATYSDTLISTLGANEDPDDMACVGVNLVVISEDSESLHYAPLADILEAVETWIEVTTGFVAGNGPLAIHSESPCHTWIVGENGYIYFADDPTAGVEVQDAGAATTQNLNDVHAYDTQNVVAVGASNAVVVTRNGGTTWTAITGPNPGVVLNTVFMRGKDEWFIGDAGGQLWYTVDGGVNWVEKTFPGSGAGVVRHITFATKSVGYMAHDTTTPAGRILRTIDGGGSWSVEPLNNLTFPANDRINHIAVPSTSPNRANFVWAGGLEDDATDGILILGSGPTGPASA